MTNVDVQTELYFSQGSRKPHHRAATEWWGEVGRSHDRLCTPTKILEIILTDCFIHWAPPGARV